MKILILRSHLDAKVDDPNLPFDDGGNAGAGAGSAGLGAGGADEEYE